MLRSIREHSVAYFFPHEISAIYRETQYFYLREKEMKIISLQTKIVYSQDCIMNSYKFSRIYVYNSK